MKSGAALFGLCLVSACAGESDPMSPEDRAPVELVYAEGWEAVEFGTDPYPDHRPPNAACPGGFWVEYGAFEVDTGLCAYGSFEQPLTDDVKPGDLIEIVVLHEQLYAEEPAAAHLAVSIDGAPVWEHEVPIPSDYNYFAAQWQADRVAEAGQPVHLHIHNHGYNTYRLIGIGRR